MFSKLFGSKPKVDPGQQRAIERKRAELNVHLSIEQLHKKLEDLEARMIAYDRRIHEQTHLALEAKRAGNKEKALRYLTTIKTLKNDLVKISGYSTLIMKQISSLESTKNDNEIAEIIKSTSKHLEQAQRQQESNMEVFEEAAALNAEFEASQEQINDIIRQQTERITEGLEEEYAQLDELEMIEAMEEKAPAKQKQQNAPPQKTKAFDDMINELLS